MKRLSSWLVALALLVAGAAATAQELVHFPTLDGASAGQPATQLDGYLFRPSTAGAAPAIVGLHGCSGMFSPATGQISPIYRQWANVFTQQGYAFLLVDSFGPRRHGEMCSVQGFDLGLYRERPRDAYGALWFLQAQPFVRADRVGLAGWSQGGGTTLLAIGTPSLGRPAALPRGDFRAAVAFYPGSCNAQRLPASWAAALPLLALIGSEDVWTPAGPCKALLDGTAPRGSPIETIVYPGAYHAFDAPNLAWRELPNYTTRAGVVPIVGTDPAARADALARVPAFFARYLN